MRHDLTIEDWVTTDPAYYDPACPPEHFPMHFMSKGAPVQGFMWLAQGAEPKGCVIIVPQFYGGDSLEGLITPLVSAGIHVLKIHPRGMWDELEYTFPGVVDDIHAAVDHLRQNGGAHVTMSGRTYNIAPDKIATLGKSGGGGGTGWAAASENEHLNVSIAVSPPDMELTRSWITQLRNGGELTPELAAFEEESARMKRATAGRIDTRATCEKLSTEDFDRLSLIKRAPALVDKRLLLIGGSADVDAPVDLTHRPLVKAMRAAGAKHLTDVIFESDIFYLTARIAMARLVLTWLRRECGF